MMKVREMEPVDLRLRAEQRCFAEREINYQNQKNYLLKHAKECGLGVGSRVSKVWKGHRWIWAGARIGKKGECEKFWLMTKLGKAGGTRESK